jgi:biopolymer transport protein ExbD
MTPEKTSQGVAWEQPDQTAEPSKPRKPGSGMGCPPLTALIDVFLFLIIYFLLSCQFHQSEGGIPANLPTAFGDGPPAGIRPEPIRVRLTAAREGVRIEVGNAGAKPADMTALYCFLRDTRARYADLAAENLPVVIAPREGVRWGCVVDAFNQAVRAGFREVGVAPSGAN